MSRAGSWICIALVATGCGGASSEARLDVSVGAERARGDDPRPIAQRCPSSDDQTFVLRYDPESGAIFPSDERDIPIEGQRIVVCVQGPDWRDFYDVRTREAVREQTAQDVRVFRVGGDDDEGEAGGGERASRSSATTPTPPAPGTPATPQPMGLSCGGPMIVNATAFLENMRGRYLEELRTRFQAPLRGEDLVVLRDRLRDLRSPIDMYYWPDPPGVSAPEPATPQPGGAEPAADAVPEPDVGPRCPQVPHPGPDGRSVVYDDAPNMRCSLDQFVNWYLLPQWLYYLHGEFYFSEERFRSDECGAARPATDAQASGENPPGAFGDDMPDSVKRIVRALERSIQRTQRLIEFSDELLTNLDPPNHIFDLGTFGGDRMVTITVTRTRRTISYREGALALVSRSRSTTRRQPVNELTYFRIEPGLAFSLLREPEYSIARNDIGDRVIQMDSDGSFLLSPVIVASFYWCGVDLRRPPWHRRCGGNGDGFFNHLLPLLPTIAVGIPIDAGLVKGSPSFFVGGAWNIVPFLSLGAGAHIHLNSTTLRDEYRVGDPVPEFFGEKDLTEGRVQAGWYFSLTINPQVWDALGRGEYLAD